MTRPRSAIGEKRIFASLDLADLQQLAPNPRGSSTVRRADSAIFS
jgi:hypothetical protein